MRVIFYRSYRFIDKDPIVDAVRTVVQDTKLKQAQVAQLSGVAGTTLHNWFDGPTRRPNNATVTAVTASLGYVRRDTLAADGTVRVRYVKARDLDYRKEIDKAADWLVKQNSGRRKKRRRKKKATNGTGPDH